MIKREPLKKIPLFTGFLLIFHLLLFYSASGQITGIANERFFSISQNSTSTLEAFGDTLWTGPGLNHWIEHEANWHVPIRADSVFNGRGRVFSLAVTENHVLAGLGYTSATATGNNVQAAMGYYLKTKTGESWQFLPFPLDPDPDPELCDSEETHYQPDCDKLFIYGGREYRRLRIMVPEQSPPFDVAIEDYSMFSVNWASGLLRSTNSGESWHRLILPPSGEPLLHPDQTYEWTSMSPNGEPLNRYDPRADNNLLAFGLLIDRERNVWTGTANGINISDNALDAPADSIVWRHIPFKGEPDGLLGGWVVTIREQPETGVVWLTNWRSDPEGRDTFGLVSTSDTGNTFRHHLKSVRVNDLTFHQDHIFVAADEGLYLSSNNGDSWDKINPIISPNTFIKDGARYLAAAATRNRVWIGTTDGIASTTDNGQNWSITRVDVPLRGGNIYQQDAPDVKTYAYPNPYSQGRHEITRIRFEVQQQNRVRIRIFDYSMSLIRNLDNRELQKGIYETIWDGRDEHGRLVHNGPVFYIIEIGRKKFHGKILVLD